MGEINYEPIIKDMTWSYSRIKAFDDCPYRWYLRYIRKLHGKDMFFSSYGSFMHKLIEMYYRDGKNPQELCRIYLQDFRNQVVGFAPNKTVFGNYFKKGLQYLKEIRPFPYDMIAVEKRVDFKLGDIPFVGYIDFLGEKDGNFYIVDNKSRVLKPRSNRNKPTKTDLELDEYLKQLYLYSAAVEQEYGVKPSALCFNCFRTPVLIEETFSEQAYTKAKQWLFDKVKEITVETDFRPDVEYFKCTHLCEMNEFCEYYRLAKKR